MPQQVTRLSIVFGVLILGLVLARQFLVPKTFGQLGHYRAAAVGEIAQLPLKYAGHQECAVCHDEVVQMHDAKRHHGVACEVCHGAAAAHVQAPTEVHLVAPRQRAACPLCHGYNPSRPTGFPQIDPVTHNPLKPCISCHNPHAPEPPHTPEDCGACHGQIARTKAVSHHAALPCTRCHETNQQHKISPLTSRPAKPVARAFCGQCHAPDAKSDPGIPRVDLASHGERYVCWQCHYPHSPEL